jgi:hypothetical protein
MQTVCCLERKRQPCTPTSTSTGPPVPQHTPPHCHRPFYYSVSVSANLTYVTLPAGPYNCYSGMLPATCICTSLQLHLLLLSAVLLLLLLPLLCTQACAASSAGSGTACCSSALSCTPCSCSPSTAAALLAHPLQLGCCKTVARVQHPSRSTCGWFTKTPTASELSPELFGAAHACCPAAAVASSCCRRLPAS